MREGSNGRHPPSLRLPARGSSSASKFSLLGQQLNPYSSQHHQAPQNMGFSLNGHPQPRGHPQQHHQSQQQQQEQQQQQVISGGSSGGLSFSNMQQQVSPLVGMGHGYSEASQYMDHTLTGNGNSFMKHNQSMGNSATVTPESIMDALQVIQQKIGQLQAIVPLLAAQTQGGQVNSSLVQQQAAAAAAAVNVISQFAMLAANMFSQTHQQQNLVNVSVAEQSVSDLQLGQLFGSAVSPGFNPFQQNEPLTMNTPLGSSMGTTFGTLPGGNLGLVGSGDSISNGLSNLSRNSQGGSMEEVDPASALVSKEYGQQVGMSGPTQSTGGSGMQNNLGVEPNNMLGRSGTTSLPGEETTVNRSSHGSEDMNGSQPSEEQDMIGVSRDDEDDGEGESLPPGSYEVVEMEAIEILAEHTHFCEICGKGFKRDANLRMHMRGHGDEYKTPAALARPDRPAHDPALVRPRRFSCPYEGCKRNKNHRKFQALKTVLCVKNHYRRSHCPKMLTCGKCKAKKFSVVADLKTHEKHCGRDKWQCSCGTTFSRKDKLFGHIGLFAGHTPALPLHEMDGSGGDVDVSEIVAASGTAFSTGSGPASRVATSNGGSASIGPSVGTAGTGLPRMTSRTGTSLSDERNVNISGSENSTSQSFPQGDNLLSGSSMLQGLYSNNFLQGSVVANQPSEALH